MVNNIGTIAAEATFKYELDVTATKLGHYSVVVGLASDKVEHVTGEKEVRGTSCQSSVRLRAGGKWEGREGCETKGWWGRKPVSE